MTCRSLSRLSLVVLGAAALAGCHLVAPLDPDQIERTEQKTYAWDQNSPVQGIDVLIVVDTTDASRLAALIGPLTEWIRGLANSQAILMAGTGTEGGGPMDVGYDAYGMPTLHVGFVTSDMGAADWEGTVVPGCTAQGDRGRLIPARVGPGFEGRFLHDFLILDGENVRNWRDASGIEENLSLDDGMAMFWAGVMQRGSTCPFQQPLNATGAALDMNLNMENLGFVRYNAALGLLLLAQQDDCSAYDTALFSPVTDPYGLGVDLGPLSTFRCFEYGVRCDQPDAIRTPGLKSGCADLPTTLDEGGGEREPTDGDILPGMQLLMPARDYAQRLVEMKGEYPVVIGSIGGLTDAIEVVNQDGLRLAPATDCSGQPIQARPSVRLKAFADAVGGEMFYSLCSADMADLMWRFNDRYQNRAVTRCFTEMVMDGNPETPEIDADCVVEFVNDPGTATEEIVASLSACSNTPQGWEEACWYIYTDTPECGALPSLFIQWAWGGSGGTIASDVVRARCTVERR